MERDVPDSDAANTDFGADAGSDVEAAAHHAVAAGGDGAEADLAQVEPSAEQDVSGGVPRAGGFSFAVVALVAVTLAALSATVTSRLLNRADECEMVRGRAAIYLATTPMPGPMDTEGWDEAASMIESVRSICPANQFAEFERTSLAVWALAAQPLPADGAPASVP